MEELFQKVSRGDKEVDRPDIKKGQKQKCEQHHRGAAKGKKKRMETGKYLEK